MGHNLGMSHDFLDGQETEEGDGYVYRKWKGKPCKGYMDYNDYTNRWSVCSNNDFKKYLKYGTRKICLRGKHVRYTWFIYIYIYIYACL